MTMAELALVVIAGLLASISWQLRAISRQLAALIKLRFPAVFED